MIYVFLLASIAAAFQLNKDQLTTNVSDGYQWAKDTGTLFKNRIGPGDIVADRKPFFAFYAGAYYLEIPIATYEEVIEYLTAEKADYLLLHRETIRYLRPALKPLLYDRAFINGELRYRQVPLERDEAERFASSNVLVYEKSGYSRPLETHQITPSDGRNRIAPAWSPNGAMIAFRTIGGKGNDGIFIISPEGGQPQQIVTEPSVMDPITWAPDSKRIAFANSSSGNMDIYIYNFDDKTTTPLIIHSGDDRSPSWSRDGIEIVFSSGRSGDNDVWSKNLVTGDLTKLTRVEEVRFPALSPDGKQLAWIRGKEGIIIYDRDTRQMIRTSVPRNVSFAPAWSPDGRFIAVTGEGYGGADVYLMTVDAAEVLVLTDTDQGDGMPSWGPEGNRLAIISRCERNFGLWVVSDIEPYKTRLMKPGNIRTVQPLP